MFTIARSRSSHSRLNALAHDGDDDGGEPGHNPALVAASSSPTSVHSASSVLAPSQAAPSASAPRAASSRASRSASLAPATLAPPFPLGSQLVIVVMGACGSGKTTMGRALSAELAVPFYEGDDFHPPENVAKMSRGEALEDDDRWPWLERLSKEVVGKSAVASDGVSVVGEAALPALSVEAVLSCSALKRSYREALLEDWRDKAQGGLMAASKEGVAARISNDRVLFVHMDAPEDLLEERLAARSRHFMPADLIPSQLQALEPLGADERGLAVHADDPITLLVHLVLSHLGHLALEAELEAAEAEIDAFEKHVEVLEGQLRDANTALMAAQVNERAGAAERHELQQLRIQHDSDVTRIHDLEAQLDADRQQHAAQVARLQARLAELERPRQDANERTPMLPRAEETSQKCPCVIS